MSEKIPNEVCPHCGVLVGPWKASKSLGTIAKCCGSTYRWDGPWEGMTRIRGTTPARPRKRRHDRV